MKNYFIVLSVFFFSVVCCSAQTAQGGSSSSSSSVGYLCNKPLPYMPVRLDVLFIGNSFSIDTNEAMPSILNSLGMSMVDIYVLYRPGCSLKQHYENLKSNEKVYELYRYNRDGSKKLEKAISLREAMRRFPYDVVVFQQYSLESGNYSSYEPYLSKLIQAYSILTISPRTTYAFNETWAYSSKHKNIGRYKDQANMYRSICNAVKEMKARSGIDIIIPCGTAVQNARRVKALATDNEFTRDNQHIDLTMGRYLLACTFFESVIGPCYSRSIRDDLSIIGKNGSKGQVNNTNRRLLQNCARLAVANNFNVSEFTGE